MQDKTHEIWNFRFVNQIIDSMADGVFTMDANGRISSWNRSMERISGYTAPDAIGKTCELFRFSRCFDKECPAGIKQCGIMTHGSSGARECHLQHKEGYDVPVIKNASVVRDEDENIIGVVETVTDLTELNNTRKKAEEAVLKLGEIHRMDNLIGQSQAMRKVFTAIIATASSNATVLVQGESGTGKELVAGAIHYNSERKDKPLIIVNCSALSESLLESELFGHVKGAYTGAMRDRVGRFEEAQGGTIFLDEIGELSSFIQVKLLRVLQEREIERVGESRRHKVDIRVIAATHQNLYSRVQKGYFREDLYYRLKVFPINLPPLRERKEDLLLLIGHFIKAQNRKTGKQIQGVSHGALRILMDYHWPGNVRELENAIEHAFVLCNKDRIDPFDLPVEIRQVEYQALFSTIPKKLRSNPMPQKKLSKNVLLNLLDECDWNKAEVGRRAGLSRTAIWKYMKKWEIPLKRPS